MQVNFRNATLEDVVALLTHEAEQTLGDLTFARSNDLFKYLGCYAGVARYMFGVEDIDHSPSLFAVMVHVRIKADQLQAVCDSGFEHNCETLDQLHEYFERRCN
jgi:hypothetical protein